MKTPLTYYGGKQQLAPTIVSIIPSHRVYVEPFIGGGAQEGLGCLGSCYPILWCQA